MSHSSHQPYRSPQHGLTCRILRNGEEVTSSTSSGPYAVVTCSGGL